MPIGICISDEHVLADLILVLKGSVEYFQQTSATKLNL